MRRSFDILILCCRYLACVHPQGDRSQTMKKLIAMAFALLAFMAAPAMAQQPEFDLYDKSDFTKQLATKNPVIVHVNTTW
jgi:hypothetical protein